MKPVNSTIKNTALRKHVPTRSCVACRTTGDKRALVRLVKCETGIEIDETGKKSGRGSYLCPVFECWETGLKGNRLEYTLRTKLTADNRQTLREYGRSFPKKEKDVK
jgi:predicted RNA-binding protein YlxR (DUF448 family)